MKRFKISKLFNGSTGSKFVLKNESRKKKD